MSQEVQVWRKSSGEFILLVPMHLEGNNVLIQAAIRRTEPV